MFALNATADPELLRGLAQDIALMKLVRAKSSLNFTTFSDQAGINSRLVGFLLVVSDMAAKLSTLEICAGGIERISDSQSKSSAPIHEKKYALASLGMAATRENKFCAIKSLPLRNKEIWRSWMPVALAKSLALISNFFKVRLNASL